MVRAPRTTAWAAVRRELTGGRHHAENGLASFVRIPTVSAERAHRRDVARGARWLAGRMHGIGLERVQVVETGGHPAVYADWVRPGRRPTVLLYGHYDVQPAARRDGWSSDPFVPVRRGDDLVGRGAADDKGPVWAHLEAMRAWLHAVGRLPVNVRVLIEGEEEIGSPNFELAVRRLGPQLRCDLVVVSDTRMLGIDRPAITRSLRGAVSLEVVVRGAAVDLHSGTFGGVAPQPAVALGAMVASCFGPGGALVVPGIPCGAHVDVREPVGDVALARSGRFAGRWGDAGCSGYALTTQRPALTVTGLTAGYQGTGPKSVVPAVARAKLNLRLPPTVVPSVAERALRTHLLGVGRRFPGVAVEIRTVGAHGGVDLDVGHAGVRAARAAYRVGFGRAPTIVRSGGSVPPAATLERLLRAPVLLAGFGLPDDGRHGPGERMHLPTFHRATVTSAAFLPLFAIATRIPTKENVPWTLSGTSR